MRPEALDHKVAPAQAFLPGNAGEGRSAFGHRHAAMVGASIVEAQGDRAAPPPDCGGQRRARRKAPGDLLPVAPAGGARCRLPQVVAQRSPNAHAPTDADGPQAGSKRVRGGGVAPRRAGPLRRDRWQGCGHLFRAQVPIAAAHPIRLPRGILRQGHRFPGAAGRHEGNEHSTAPVVMPLRVRSAEDIRAGLLAAGLRIRETRRRRQGDWAAGHSTCDLRRRGSHCGLPDDHRNSRHPGERRQQGRPRRVHGGSLLSH